MDDHRPVDTEENLQHVLYEGLNEHGFLFQERCAEVLESNQKATEWLVLNKEYPVSATVKDTRIDIVLKDIKSYPKAKNVYAVVECKRVNPGRTCWLFGKPLLPAFNQPLLLNLRGQTYPTDRYTDKVIKHGQIRHLPDKREFLEYALVKPRFNNLITYLVDNWWLELGRKQKRYSSPQPIEDALIQACIGVSGMAQEQEVQWGKGPEQDEFSVTLIPIVITNAPLYIAMYDLGDVDLASGAIKPDKVYFGPDGQRPERIEWLLVDYGVGRSLTPDRLYESVTGTSPVDLEDYHKRSIYVVDSQRMLQFFSRLHLD